MLQHLCRFEGTIEPRIISYSCPRGTSSRILSRRLQRRGFRNSALRSSTALTEASLASHERISSSEPAPLLDLQQTYTSNGNQEAQLKLGTSRRPERYFALGAAINSSEEFQWLQTKADDELHKARHEDSLRKFEEDRVYDGVRKSDPHTVMRALMNLIELERLGFPSTIMVSAPPSTFSEILRCIDPKYFVEPYANVFGEISTISTNLVGRQDILGDNAYYEFCTTFLTQTIRILDARRKNWPLSLSDYKYLLKCARSVGHARAAEQIWKTMTTPPQRSDTAAIVPDAEAFNYLIGVKAWQDKMNPKHRYRLRVIDENFAPRLMANVPHSLSSHRVGPDRGIKAQVSNHFRQMVELGITGNEETFCLMIIALGRENDMSGISAILKRVWNINVEAVMSEEESEDTKPIAYTPNSPFFPSNHLMYAIAHAYGSNNDISTALRLLDHISRQYAITIPLIAWDEVLQWTSILAINRSLVRKQAGEIKHTGRETGQLPSEAVSNLWQTMTSEPYNVKPTIQMYNRLITSLLKRERFGEVQWRLREAHEVLKEEVALLSKKQAMFVAVQGNQKRDLVEARARDLVFARFRLWRNRQYMQRWLRMLLRRGDYSFRNNDDWHQKNVPDIVKEWVLFLPRRIEYRLPHGTISFWTGSSHLNAWRRGMLRKRSTWQAEQEVAYPETDEAHAETIISER